MNHVGPPLNYVGPSLNYLGPPLNYLGSPDDEEIGERREEEQQE